MKSFLLASMLTSLLFASGFDNLKEFMDVVKDQVGFLSIFVSGFSIDNDGIMHLSPSIYFVTSLIVLPLVIYLLMNKIEKNTKIITSLSFSLIILFSFYYITIQTPNIQKKYEKKLYDKYHIDKKNKIYFFL